MTQLQMTSLFNYGRTRHAERTVTTVRDGRAITLTFAEVAARAVQLSQALAARGVRSGDVIVAFCRNHHEHLEMLFASHLLGTCFVPINSRSDDESLRSMFATAPPKVVFADTEAVGRLNSGLVADEVIRVVTSVAQGWDSYETLIGEGQQAEPVTASEESENSTAVILFSGGTTGTPKGVAYTQRALFLHTTLYSSNPSRPLNPGDRALILVPICHGLAWQLPHVSWLLGVDMVFIDGSLPGSAVFDAIVLTEATFAAGVPTVWHDVVGHARARSAQGIGSLRTVKLGGAMVPESLPHSLKELGVTTYVSWGLTETLPASMSLVASPRPEVSVEPDVRTSRPIPGAELRAIESENGEGGALEIRAPWITGAYVGRAAPMSEWFDTGDVGHVLETGQFTLSGRAKDMIKSGGETIWPGPIEAALLHHPHVTDAAVIEIPHERWGGQPLACVHVDGEVTPAELRTFLLSKLPKWQVPVAWVQVDRLPHTAIGKVDKRHLTKLVADGALMPDYAPY